MHDIALCTIDFLSVSIILVLQDLSFFPYDILILLQIDAASQIVHIMFPI